MINIIIFSRNRACQLELLLRSIQLMWNDCQTIKVLCKIDNEKFKKGYDKVYDRYYNNIWLYIEYNFKKNLLELIDRNKRYTVFFTDDDVFKESWALDSEYFQYFDKYDLLGISLRMHPRMNYCYTKGRKMQIPEFNNNMWEWKKYNDDWGYSMSLDGTIFLTQDIFSLLEKLDYKNPNTLESQLARNPINKKYIVCYNRSKIVNIPLNRVQQVYKNNSMKIKPEYLNEKFIEGYRISLDNIIGIDNNSPHYPLEIKWEKI